MLCVYPNAQSGPMISKFIYLLMAERLLVPNSVIDHFIGITSTGTIKEADFVFDFAPQST